MLDISYSIGYNIVSDIIAIISNEEARRKGISRGNAFLLTIMCECRKKGGDSFEKKGICVAWMVSNLEGGIS